MIEFTVPGTPQGKARPRFNRVTGTTYTPKETQQAERLVQAHWMAAGRVTLDGPLSFHVEAVMARPKDHWKKDGTLSAGGERSPWPLKVPDVSNVLKLVEDALNELAYRDDALIVHASGTRRWANPGEHEHVRVVIRQVEDHVLPVAA